MFIEPEGESVGNGRAVAKLEAVEASRVPDTPTVLPDTPTVVPKRLESVDEVVGRLVELFMGELGVKLIVGMLVGMLVE